MNDTNGSAGTNQWVDQCLKQRANQRGTYEELGQRLSETMQTLARQMEQGADPVDTPPAIRAVIRDLCGMSAAEPMRNKRHRMRCNVERNKQDAQIIMSLRRRLDPTVLRDLTSRTAFYRTLVRETIQQHWIMKSLDDLSYHETQQIVLRLLGTSIRPNRLQLGLSRMFKQAKPSVALNIQSPTGSGKTFGVESVLMDSKLKERHIIVFVPASIETLKQFIAATEQARIPFCIAEMDGTLIANTETLAFGGVKDPVPRTMEALHERLVRRKRGQESTSRGKVQRRRQMTRRQRRFIARLRGGVHALYPSVVVAAPWMRWVPSLLPRLVQDVESFGDRHGKSVTVFFDDFMATDQDLLRGVGMVQTLVCARRVCCMSATSASLETADLLNRHRESRGLARFVDRVYDDNRGLGMRLAVPLNREPHPETVAAKQELRPWSILDHRFAAFVAGPEKSPYALATVSPGRTFRLLARLFDTELKARNFLLRTIAQETALSFDIFRRKAVSMLATLDSAKRSEVLRAIPPDPIVTKEPTPKRQWLILDQRPRERANRRGAERPVMMFRGTEHSWIGRLTKAVEDVQQMKSKQREIHAKMLKTKGGDMRVTSVPGDTGANVDFVFPNLHPIFQHNDQVVKAVLDRAADTGTSEADQASCFQQARLTVDRNTAAAWVKSTLRYAAEIDGTPETMGYGVHLTTLDRVDLPSQPTTGLDTDIITLINHPGDTVSVAALIQGAGRVGRSKQTGQSTVVAATADARQFETMFSPEFRQFQNRLVAHACQLYLPTTPVAMAPMPTSMPTPMPTSMPMPMPVALARNITTTITEPNGPESTSPGRYIPDSWDNSDDDDDEPTECRA